MRHFVLMKLRDGAFDAAAEADYRATFQALKEALPQDVLAVRVARDVVHRPTSMDVMIEMRLRDVSSLEKYLTHPLHVAIGERYNPLVERIASFDMYDTDETEGEGL